MSSAHDDTSHEGPIKTPKQLVATVAAAFIVPIVGIILLASYVANGARPGAGSDQSPEAQAARILPVGSVRLALASGGGAPKTGEQVYQAQCAGCHATGAAGSPKFGDAAAWAPRIGQGYDTLLSHALKGKGAMAPQGGAAHSDFEIGRAVVYMANQGGAKFAEPKAPEAAASAAK